jgi:hypothetical protein
MVEADAGPVSGGGIVEADKEIVKQLLDMVVSTDHFSSGFLDSEQVETLRRAAEWVGADPNKFTPYQFYDKYNVPLQDWEFDRIKYIKGRLKALDETALPPYISPTGRKEYLGDYKIYESELERLMRRAKANNQEVE